MATSMTLGNSILGMGSNSPMSSGMGLGNMTPSHNGMKFDDESGTIHSPLSQNSTPNSSITINGSIGKCPSTGNINGENSSVMSPGSDSDFGAKCKRKINFSNLGIPPRGHQPATVARRNARERNRVKQVNNGFASLKQHIPLGHRSKKMSKVETLRCAVDYIRNLQGLLTIQSSLSVASPSDSTVSDNSGDILMDDENMELHQSTTTSQQQQMNGVNNQRDAYALSSSSSTTSSSSSPTSSDFGAVVAHLPHHLAALHAHHQSQHQHQEQQYLVGNNNNQLRHLSSLSQHHHNHQLHGTNGLSVPAALLLDSATNNTVTPNSNQLSPTSSEDSASPSYASEVSYVNSNGNIKGNGMYDYEKYEPVSPEDEELLDAIAFWQQS